MNTCLSLTCSASLKADKKVQTLPQFSLKTVFSNPLPVTKSHVCEYCDEDPNPLANVVVSHCPGRFAARRGQNQNTWNQKETHRDGLGCCWEAQVNVISRLAYGVKALSPFPWRMYLYL